MRQAGVLAAAGLIAMKKMRLRLNKDHDLARKLAVGLKDVSGLKVDTIEPKTNMVYCLLDDGVMLSGEEIVEYMKDKGILVGMISNNYFRLVTHYQINADDIDRVVEAFRKILQ